MWLINLELINLLSYKNQRVLDYFGSQYPEVKPQDRELLFDDLKAWMWLNAFRAQHGKKTYLFGPLLILDKMWHSFILHTRDYVEFSHHYFSDYFHHDIEPIATEHLICEDELNDFLEDCFIYLGAEWVKRRFKEAI